MYKALKHEVPPGSKIYYEPEQIEYTVTSTYTPDFLIVTKAGKKIYIEAKGNGRQFDHQVRKKMIAVKEQNPELDIRILFYSDGKIGPTRKDGSFRRQSDWATQHGFIFAIREIPKSWFNDE